MSFVKYVPGRGVVSASTDCTLRLWNTPERDAAGVFAEKSEPKVFRGHLNEKNFVGLSVNSSGKFIACGM